jgi:hypothetical protein
MPDPLDRLTLAQQKIDELFGSGFAREHPEVVVVVVQSAASDWAAARLAIAIERVAEALLVEEAETKSGRPDLLVPAREWRP